MQPASNSSSPCASPLLPRSPHPPRHLQSSATSNHVINSRRRSNSHHVPFPITIHSNVPAFDPMSPNRRLTHHNSRIVSPHPTSSTKLKFSPPASTPPPPPYNQPPPSASITEEESPKTSSFVGFPSPRTLRTMLDSSSRSIQINVHNYFSRSGSPVISPAESLSNLYSYIRAFFTSIRLPLMCLTWYAASALTNNAKKQILIQFKYPVSLTMAQFFAVIVLCLLAQSRRWMNLQSPTWVVARTILPLSICQLAGHTLTSMAISRVPVAFVHTVKALGPLFTVLINHFILRSKSSSSVWLSLIPLTFGVVLACSFGKASMAFHWTGFFLSALSTIIFVLQNIVSKSIMSKHAVHPASSAAMPTKLSNSSYDPLLPTHVGSAVDVLTPPVNLDKINIMFYSSVLAWLAMVPMWLSSDFPIFLLSARDIVVDRKLVFLFFLNGISHFTQSLLAFTILAHVTTVTYSIVSLLKRIVVIVAAIAWFGDSVSGMQAVGVTLTFTGLWMYQQAKRGNSQSVKHSD